GSFCPAEAMGRCGRCALLRRSIARGPAGAPPAWRPHSSKRLSRALLNSWYARCSAGPCRNRPVTRPIPAYANTSGNSVPTQPVSGAAESKTTYEPPPDHWVNPCAATVTFTSMVRTRCVADHAGHPAVGAVPHAERSPQHARSDVRELRGISRTDRGRQAEAEAGGGTPAGGRSRRVQLRHQRLPTFRGRGPGCAGTSVRPWSRERRVGRGAGSWCERACPGRRRLPGLRAHRLWSMPQVRRRAGDLL